MGSIQNWLDRFCHKHPNLAIPNLMLYIVLGNVAVFILDMFSHGAASYFSFNSVAILENLQLWRLITFIFVPTDGNLFFFAISMYFYYFLGNMLEREWGSAKFTIYYAIGILTNIMVGFLVGTTNVMYMNMALFFAFATLYGETIVLLFFILPIKIKWLAYLSGGIFVFQIIGLLTSGYPMLALIPIAAILNYLLFFGTSLFTGMKETAQVHQQQARRKKNKPVDFQSASQHVKDKKGYLHKCAVCGRTDVTNPELDFRYCSKCKGYHCYCSEHLHTHVHIE